jgi:hypothetical protein
MKFYSSVLQVGDVVESRGSGDVPAAMGTVIAIKRDTTGNASLDEYFVQVGANLIGVYRASQLVYVESVMPALAHV